MSILTAKSAVPMRVGAFCFVRILYLVFRLLTTFYRLLTIHLHSFVSSKLPSLRHVRYVEGFYIITLLCSYETQKSTISFHPPEEDFRVQFWNESTSRFPYPCLVHVVQTFLPAWTIPSPREISFHFTRGQRLIAVSLRLQPALLLSHSACAEFQSLRVLRESHIYPSLYCIDGRTYREIISANFPILFRRTKILTFPLFF